MLLLATNIKRIFLAHAQSQSHYQMQAKWQYCNDETEVKAKKNAQYCKITVRKEKNTS